MTYASDGQSETGLNYRTTPLPIASAFKIYRYLYVSNIF